VEYVQKYEALGIDQEEVRVVARILKIESQWGLLWHVVVVSDEWLRFNELYTRDVVEEISKLANVAWGTRIEQFLQLDDLQAV